MNILILCIIAVVVAPLAVVWSRARKRLSMQRDAPKFSTALDSTGFAITDLRQTASDSLCLVWSEVYRVIAYKRDLFAYDCICLFIARADDTGVELDEEMIGWKAFCEALPRCLPGCAPFEDWFRPVAFPAFETNRTDLYTREVVQGV